MVLVCTILGCPLSEIGSTVGSTVEAALVAAGKLYGIYIAIFAQGIGKVPHGFGMTGCDDAKAIVGSACKGLAFHFAMQREALGQFAIGNKNKLAEVDSEMLTPML